MQGGVETLGQTTCKSTITWPITCTSSRLLRMCKKKNVYNERGAFKRILEGKTWVAGGLANAEARKKVVLALMN